MMVIPRPPHNSGVKGLKGEELMGGKPRGTTLCLSGTVWRSGCSYGTRFSPSRKRVCSPDWLLVQ
jgi:hypothetical protein